MFFRVSLVAIVGALDKAVHVLARPAVDPVVGVLDRWRLEPFDDETVTKGRQLFFEFFFRQAPGVRARAEQQAAKCQGANA